MKLNTLHNSKQMPQTAPLCGSFDVRGYEWNIMKPMEGHTY